MLELHDCPRWPLVLIALSMLGALQACGGTMSFSDKSALVITGDGPAPPPPPPEEPKRVEVTQGAIVIKEKIQFDFDKSTIKPESHGLLDEIVKVITDNPHIKKISIEGHTDADGSDKYNLRLSDGRAKAVMTYLVDHGIAAKRLSAKGFGESKPLGENDTDAGKEANRRVEFLITEQEEVKKTFEVDPESGKRTEVAP